MKLILSRREFRDDGIFGELKNERYEHLFVTLEHSFGGIPAVTPGDYKCERGLHSLPSDPDDFFDTFEVMEVPGHTGILFHVGNYNEDSAGCILIGEGNGAKLNGGKMITNSRKSFKEFMNMLKDHSSFELKIEVV